MTTTPPAGAGTLGVGDDGTFRIQFDRTLRHPLPAVWAALTDPAKLSVWLPGCRIEARVGGDVRYDFGEEGAATGEVTALRAADDAEPTAELEHTWRWDGLPVSVVTWRLEPADGGTRLVLTHREVGRAPATDFAVGWHVILDSLDRWADGRTSDDVWDSYDTLARHYAGA
ncbi:SRPBCC family protein [Promicromonospora iranensis]|uniref:SRPBCC family protein n=1 Tax=Promicromonospora iranensis TaxID=1105144 RepID=UPI0023A9528D|nr:SRPBCC family protein [Promicromonospora iranensis]